MRQERHQVDRPGYTDAHMPLVTPGEAALRPPLKWAGGKRWQLPHLGPLWKPNADRRLVEPFCGGLAVALGLKPARAWLNDANPHLVNFYTWLQRGLHIQIPMENDERVFYRHRDRFNAILVAGDGSGRGGGRALLLSEPNRIQRALPVQPSRPFQRAVRPLHAHPVHARFLRPIAKRLPGGRSRAATSRVCRSNPTDFVYADPPYDVEFTQYARGGFTWRDQERTARWLSRHPGPVVLVNQATDRMERALSRAGVRGAVSARPAADQLHR